MQNIEDDKHVHECHTSRGLGAYSRCCQAGTLPNFRGPALFELPPAPAVDPLSHAASRGPTECYEVHVQKPYESCFLK